MNKKLVILGLTCLLVFPLVALAINYPPLDPGGDVSFTDIINGVFNVIWPLFEVFATVMFIAAGFLFLTANGDPSKIKLAKSALLWGIIGVVVGILAFSVPTIVSDILGLS